MKMEKYLQNLLAIKSGSERSSLLITNIDEKSFV